MLQRLSVLALSALVGSGAAAQVTAVVTNTTADVSLAEGDFSFSGNLLDGTKSDLSPSGASYVSRSDVEGPEIFFVNGNASGGSYAGTTSLTTVDVSFTNDSDSAVNTTVRSTLLPAGFGFFVSTAGCASGPITSCKEAVGGPSFASFTNSDPRSFEPLAFASFDFSIVSGDFSLFTLTGSLSLVFDPTIGRNVIRTDIVDAAGVLRNFARATPVDSPTGLAYVWDATDIDLDLGLIAAGESRTLTYSTSATSFTRSGGVGTCGLAAFSEFGDPIARGGSIPPPTRRVAAAADPCAGGQTGGLTLQRPSLFRFPVPTFENGVLSVLVGSTVPEPATWAMLVTGFGLAGAAQRRRRRAVA